MRLKRLLLILYIIPLLVASMTSCEPDNQESTAPTDYGPPSFGNCVTYIENESGSVKLTDTIGYAFEFDVVLKRNFNSLGFEIPVYSDKDSSLITVSTSGNGDLKPKIYVNGQQSDSLPSEAGNYKIRLDISHITSRGYTAGNTLTATEFGKIDLICLY